LWAITREPQNLVLQNIDEAYKQLTNQGNYFPDTEAAQTSLEHKDTVVVNLRELGLVKYNHQHRDGYFEVNPEAVTRLNYEQRKAAQRIYGPDEENFGLNMEMFAEARTNPRVYVLMPDYVQSTLRSNDEKFVGRASWLGSFYNGSIFLADDRYVNYRYNLRGVRRAITVGAKNEVPPAPQEMGTVRSPTMEDILAVSQSHVSNSDRD